MARNILIVSFIFLLAFLPAFSFCQDLIKARGSAQMVLEDNMSKEDLQEELRRLAKIDAIENQFGSIIEQESRVEINEGGTTFNIVGDRYLKGEWIETTREHFAEEYVKIKGKGKKDYELWMSCELTGIIREITQPEILFEWTTTNCPEKVCRTTDFISGEPMYLFFQSPVKGYLNVYSTEDEQTFRLLPYQNMSGNYSQHVPVSADVEYLFFSTDPHHNRLENFSHLNADELIMTTEDDEEYVYLYIVFSTKEFVKPTLDHSYASSVNDYIVPRSLKISEFESWLVENRIRNQNFYYKKLRLKIIN